jgi:hypothetical protein
VPPITKTAKPTRLLRGFVSFFLPRRDEDTSSGFRITSRERQSVPVPGHVPSELRIGDYVAWIGQTQSRIQLPPSITPLGLRHRTQMQHPCPISPRMRYDPSPADDCRPPGADVSADSTEAERSANAPTCHRRRASPASHTFLPRPCLVPFHTSLDRRPRKVSLGRGHP